MLSVTPPFSVISHPASPGQNRDRVPLALSLYPLTFQRSTSFFDISPSCKAISPSVSFLPPFLLSAETTLSLIHWFPHPSPGTLPCNNRRYNTCPYICTLTTNQADKQHVKMWNGFTCTSCNLICCNRYFLCCLLYISDHRRFAEHLHAVCNVHFELLIASRFKSPPHFHPDLFFHCPTTRVRPNITKRDCLIFCLGDLMA